MAMEGSPRRGAAAMLAATVLLAPTLLTGCEPGVLDPAGPVGGAERTLMLNALAIMLSIIVPVIVLALAFGWWFRAGNARARYRPDWSYSGQLELLVWSIPLLAIIFLAGITWIASHRLDPPRPLASRVPPLRVEVISLDWKWLFLYPDQGLASVNRLVIPAGTPVTFRVTSGTVMNSFFVPRLGSQIYAMAGMVNRLNLQADRPGLYRGISAHYSGEGFADMDFAVDAVPRATFARWVAAQKAKPTPPLDAQHYLALARAAATSAPVTFRALQPGLFDAAVRQAGAPVRDQATDGREDAHVR